MPSACAVTAASVKAAETSSDFAMREIINFSSRKRIEACAWDRRTWPPPEPTDVAYSSLNFPRVNFKIDMR
jgi:hypothetical protein